MDKKCDTCGRINKGDYFEEGDACWYCCQGLWNEYGRFHRPQNIEFNGKSKMAKKIAKIGEKK